MLAQSSAAAWAKLAALGVNGLLLAALCFTASRRRPILGALLCLPAIGVAAMFLDLHLTPVQTLAFLAAWMPLLIMATKSAVTGRTRRA